MVLLNKKQLVQCRPLQPQFDARVHMSTRSVEGRVDLQPSCVNTLFDRVGIDGHDSNARTDGRKLNQQSSKTAT